MDTLYSIETSTNDKINQLRKEGLAHQAAGKGGKQRGIISRIFSWITGMRAPSAETQTGVAKESGRIEHVHQV